MRVAHLAEGGRIDEAKVAFDQDRERRLGAVPDKFLQ
jgi:hypothetical protein